MLGVVLTAKPYARPRDLFVDFFVYTTQCVALIFMAVGYYREKPQDLLFQGATVLLLFSLGCLMLKVALSLVCEVLVVLTCRRHRLQQEYLRSTKEYPHDTELPAPSEASESGVEEDSNSDVGCDLSGYNSASTFSGDDVLHPLQAEGAEALQTRGRGLKSRYKKLRSTASGLLKGRAYTSQRAFDPLLLNAVNSSRPATPLSPLLSEVSDLSESFEMRTQLATSPSPTPLPFGATYSSRPSLAQRTRSHSGVLATPTSSAVTMCTAPSSIARGRRGSLCHSAGLSQTYSGLRSDRGGGGGGGSGGASPIPPRRRSAVSGVAT